MFSKTWVQNKTFNNSPKWVSKYTQVCQPLPQNADPSTRASAGTQAGSHTQAHTGVAKACWDCSGWVRRALGLFVIRDGVTSWTCRASTVWLDQQSHLRWHLSETRCHMLMAHDTATGWQRPEKCCWAEGQTLRFVIFVYSRNVLWPSSGFWVTLWDQRWQGQKRDGGTFKGIL